MDFKRSEGAAALTPRGSTAGAAGAAGFLFGAGDIPIEVDVPLDIQLHAARLQIVVGTTLGADGLELTLQHRDRDESQRKTDHQLAHCLNDLSHRGGDHITLTVEVTTISGHQAA